MEGGEKCVCDGAEGRARKGRAGQARAGECMARQGRAGKGRAVQIRVRKAEGNAKCNAGHSALQEKAKGITDYAQGEGQGRAECK